MICPKCGSENCHFVSQTNTSNGSFCDGCCGFILFGPIGILCGLCGRDTNTKEFWVCDNCGAKFTKGGQKKNVNVINVSSSSAVTAKYTDLINQQDNRVICPKCKKPLNALGKCNFCGFDNSSEGIKLKKSERLLVEADKNITPNNFHSGNIIGKSLVTNFGEYIYYVKSSQNSGYELVRLKNSGNSKISVNMVLYLFADENGVYYLEETNENKFSVHFKMKFLDNTKDTPTVLSNFYAVEMFLYQNKIYYINEDDRNSIYVIDTKGNGNHRLVIGKCKNIVVYKGHIYYIAKSNNNRLCCYSLENKSNRVLVPEGKVDKFCIDNDNLYYEYNTINDVFTTYCLDLSTLSKSCIGQMPNSFVNVNGDNIIICNKGYMMRYSISQKNTSVYDVKGEFIKNVFVCGEYLYYGTVYEIFGRVKTDGSENEKL